MKVNKIVQQPARIYLTFNNSSRYGGNRVYETIRQILRRHLDRGIYQILSSECDRVWEKSTTRGMCITIIPITNRSDFEDQCLKMVDEIICQLGLHNATIDINGTTLLCQSSVPLPYLDSKVMF